MTTPSRIDEVRARLAALDAAREAYEAARDENGIITSSRPEWSRLVIAGERVKHNVESDLRHLLAELDARDEVIARSRAATTCKMVFIEEELMELEHALAKFDARGREGT